MTSRFEGSDVVLENAVLNARVAMIKLREAEARRAETHGFLSRLVASQTVHYWESRVLDTEEHLDMVEQVRLFKAGQPTQVSTTQEERFFDPEEMSRFGLDPRSALDREEWISTTPPDGTPSQKADYSRDPFEFGGPDIEPEIT